MLPLAPAPATADHPSWGRLFGASRYDTSAAIARAAYPGTAREVVVATGLDFPDGLVGGALATSRGGPVLLVPPDALPDSIAAELRRLSPTRVLVLGGTGSVSDAVLDAIGGTTNGVVQRVAGADRYDTAAAAAGLTPPGAGTVVVASGEAFPDAMVGATAAGAAGGPVLLTGRTSLPASARTQLARLAPARILLVGGSAAVSEQVAEELRRFAPVTRLAGADRFATAVEVARTTFPQAAGALVATGLSFADALAAAPLAVKAGQPVLLAHPRCAPSPTVDLLRSRAWPPLTLVGGPAALADGVARLVPCSPPPDGRHAPGVELQTLFRPGPNVVKVLTLDRRQGATIRSVLATGRVGGRETVTSIARRHGAVAAVNGDFFLGDGRPVHAFATGGRLLHYPGLVQNQFGVNELDHGSAFTGWAAWNVSATIEETGAATSVHKINTGLAALGEMAVLTPEAGGHGAVPADACTAVLRPAATAGLDADGDASQRLRVERAGCGQPPPPIDADVLVAPPGGAAGAFIASAQPGQHVVLAWRARPDWPGILDSTGGAPILVEGGHLTAEMRDQRGGAYEELAPRTAVGLLPDGRLLLVTVDGRQPGYSVGMRLRDLAQVFVELGAVGAMNLDGGGSTAMAVGGLLTNSPSDAGGERAVGTALLVFSGPAPASATLSAPAVPTSAQLADPARDPGSLGGYVELLEQRGEAPEALARLVDDP